MQFAAGQVVRLYNRWHVAEPGQGYDAAVAEWRAKLTAAADASDA